MLESLDEIGIRSGTDKSRLVHDYLRQYERVLAHLRDRPLVLIEIGIDRGASLTVWETFFPKATIVGVDIEPATRRFARDRVRVEIGSQSDKAFLDDLSARYVPDVIVDDGSHVEEHQIFTFETLFPSLKAGGAYIVEDIQNFAVPTLAADYFLSLQRECLLRRSRPDIASIKVIPGAVIVFKAEPVLDKAGEDDLERRALAADQPESVLYLCRYIQRMGGSHLEALKIAEKAIERDPQNPWCHYEASRLLHATGRLGEAIAAGERAAALSLSSDPLFLNHVKYMRGERS